MMKAISIAEPGGPAVLREIDYPVPRPGASEVLIRAHAAGVNRPDVLQRLGKYPVPPDASPLPGLEVAGEIVAVGDDVERWHSGDRVMALTHGGGYAEYCAVEGGHCLPIPSNLSFVEAAAVPETFFTVWYNVFTRCRLGDGETFLVHGGSSGIGTTAIQLAKAHDCFVITTAGSDEKCAFCEELGADKAFNYRDEDWQAGVRDLTDGLTITGSTLRPQTVAEKSRIATDLERNVLPLFESGRVRPIIHQSFPLDAAAAAHELMESSRHMGKIVLTTSDTAQEVATHD
jgi:NADPH2:quinone reductase